MGGGGGGREVLRPLRDDYCIMLYSIGTPRRVRNPKKRAAYFSYDINDKCGWIWKRKKNKTENKCRVTSGTNWYTKLYTILLLGYKYITYIYERYIYMFLGLAMFSYILIYTVCAR